MPPRIPQPNGTASDEPVRQRRVAAWIIRVRLHAVATGPIGKYRDGVFAIGRSAGLAHPFLDAEAGRQTPSPRRDLPRVQPGTRRDRPRGKGAARKRVMSGKRGSVRVAHGGRRILNKKKQTNTK